MQHEQIAATVQVCPSRIYKLDCHEFVCVMGASFSYSDIFKLFIDQMLYCVQVIRAVGSPESPPFIENVAKYQNIIVLLDWT